MLLFVAVREAKLQCRQMLVYEGTTYCFEKMPVCISNCEIFLCLVLWFYLKILSSFGHVLLLNTENCKN